MSLASIPTKDEMNNGILEEVLTMVDVIVTSQQGNPSVNHKYPSVPGMIISTDGFGAFTSDRMYSVHRASYVIKGVVINSGDCPYVEISLFAPLDVIMNSWEEIKKKIILMKTTYEKGVSKNE